MAAIRADIPKENVKDAIPYKEYSGTVIGYEKGFLMLQTSQSEAILFKGIDLDSIPEIAETVKIGDQYLDSRRTVKSASQTRGSFTR
jgi:hypothetical protein